MLRTALFASLLALSISSVARADAVDPPPSSCPPGSTPTSSHAGPICAPSAECDPNAPCSGGESCITVRQCVEQRPCGGRLPPDSGPCVVEHVVGGCEPDGSCSVGTCRTRSVCATGGGGTSSGGCGCVVGAPRRAHGAALLVLMMGAALALARRR